MSTRAQLTILTDPIPHGILRVSENLKQMARGLRDVFSAPPRFARSPYRGHFAVTRSLVEGLRKCDCSFNYNPKSLNDIADVVIVLSGVSALRQAIRMKRQGRIKTLLAGPNLIDFPSDQGSIICSPEVDLCVTPGPLTSEIYIEDCPSLKGRCVGWPAGVNVDFWSPLHNLRTRTIVVYDKPSKGPKDSSNRYIEWIEKRGFKVSVIEYGRYRKEDYLHALRQGSLLVGFSAAESQGIAWVEAWAVDVPTLLWYKDRHTYNHPRSVGRTFGSSPAPYLSANTGAFFRTFDEFVQRFEAWESGTVTFSARKWTVENMSDEVCARRLWEIAVLGTGRKCS